MKNRFKKGIAQAISMMLAAIVLLGVIPQTAGRVYAADDKTISGLGTGAIANPTPGAGGWSFVYYGSYNGNSVKYRVLDNDATEYGGHTILLDCDNMFQSMEYDANGDSWKDSDLYAWLNGSNFLGSENVFTGLERSAIASSYKNSASSSDGEGFRFTENNNPQRCSFQPITGEKIFVLDAMETSNASYGYTSGNSAKCQNGVSAGWWLRSNFSIGANKYAVARQDERDGYDARKGRHGISPAFNVDLSSVIFSSLISGTAGASGAEYKLTLKDEDMSVSVTEGSDITRDGATITVPYTITGSNAGNATKVSVVIKEGEWNLGTSAADGYTYLKLDVDSFGTSGTGSFTMPEEYADMEFGTDYFVYLLAEDVNEGNSTDYASAPVSVTIPELTRGNGYEPAPSPFPSNGDDNNSTFNTNSNDDNNNSSSNTNSNDDNSNSSLNTNANGDNSNSSSNTNANGDNGNSSSNTNTNDDNSNSSSNTNTNGDNNNSSSNTNLNDANGDANNTNNNSTNNNNNANTNNSNTNSNSNTNTNSNNGTDNASSDNGNSSDNSDSSADLCYGCKGSEYYDDLRALISIAIELGGEQTIYYDKWNKLPYDIMKTLEKNPQITVVYSFSYLEQDYRVFVNGSKIKANPFIYWYGPLYLNQYFGEWTI